MKKRVKAYHDVFMQEVANKIASHDRMLIAVAGTKKLPAFVYTIGNQEKGLPELLLIGNFRPTTIGDVLNALSEKMLERRKPFTDGEQVSLGGNYPLLIYSTGPEAKSEYTIQAGQFYRNEDYQVQQVLMPDRGGHYPTEAVCHKDFKVPVLKRAKP